MKLKKFTYFRMQLEKLLVISIEGDCVTKFQCATKIISGSGSVEFLRSLRAEQVFLVTDSYFSENGTGIKIASMIQGAKVTVFDRVVPDPSAALAAEGAAICVKIRPQILLALGGGSVIDCAKGIRAAYDGNLLFIAVPTTSGSGSEMTSYAVLISGQVKHPLVNEALRPNIALLDDQLLGALPQSLIADTGMDVMTHCMEALVSVNGNGFTEALAVAGICNVFHFLRESYQGDRSVRLKLHEVSSMAGMAFENAGLGLCHAAAHSLGGQFHIPHGRLCGILLPHVIQCNAAVNLEKYAGLSRNCGYGGATDKLALRNLIFELNKLRRDLKLPENLKQAGVTSEEWKQKKDDVIEAAQKDPCCGTNPVPVTRELLEDLFEKVAP